jgi:hypothetical protein
VDPADTDYASSGYDTGSTSLSSRIHEYVFENGIDRCYNFTLLISNAESKGRRYHAYYGEDKNLLPTDEV